ncbi:MAG TPA: hypothetical protein DET40_07375 [Lentisphaeria bacterium]|nr:MAG: hypothetical protein A2X45_06925 [Lentisphaerae bacterium GWF2_50_93]HCE43352.1 hypothetical protein [Lentisphaeria bacterium]
MIPNLKHKLKSLAIADAIVEPEWQYRYFSYNSKWAPNEEMASMRDGCGGSWFVLFLGERVGYKCISPGDGLIENYSKIRETIPIEYKSFIDEPSFFKDEATAVWILDKNQWIKFGKTEVREIIDLEAIMKWEPENYKEWADGYFEKEIDLDALIQVFEHKITEEVVAALNKEISLDEIKADIEEIGITP